MCRRISLSEACAFVNRPLKFIVCCIVLFNFVSLLEGQNSALRARVAVLPVINRTEGAGYEAVCKAVHDTLLLTLSFIDTYELVELEIDADRELGDVEDFLSAGRGKRLDNIVVGSLSLDKNGRPKFDFSVYDAHKGSIVLSRTKRADSLLHVFEAADKLVTELMGAFSGMHIGFGTIKLVVPAQAWRLTSKTVDSAITL